MATVQGPGGNFATDIGIGGKISGWSGGPQVGTADTTGFVDAGYVVVEAVDEQWVGTAVGTVTNGTGIVTGTGGDYLPTTAFGAAPTLSAWNGNITLTEYTGSTVSFPALIIPSVDRPARGKMSLTLNFQSRGAITRTRSS